MSEKLKTESGWIMYTPQSAAENAKDDGSSRAEGNSPADSGQTGEQNGASLPQDDQTAAGLPVIEQNMETPAVETAQPITSESSQGDPSTTGQEQPTDTAASGEEFMVTPATGEDASAGAAATDGGSGGSGSDDSGGAKPDEPGDSLTLMDHFRELRGRLVKSFIVVVLGFCVCWAFRSYLVDFLYAPLLSALQSTGQDPKTIATGVAENFFTIMKIAFVGGIFLGSPLIFYQIWAFIAPGLYDEEKVYIVPVAIASALFFLAGASFCYFVVFANALPFLLGFGEAYMANTPKASEYYNFALQLLFAFGLIFEMPLFVFFLARLGIVTARMLSRFRRYFIVIAFIASAVLTPPDVMSQLLMAAPMLLLYEFSIIIARIFGRDKKKKEKDKPGQDSADDPNGPSEKTGQTGQTV